MGLNARAAKQLRARLAAAEKRVEELEADLKLNASMLARQCDMAREAEGQGAALREVLRRYIEADDACRSRVYTCRQEDCDDGHCPIWGGEVAEHPCLYRDGLHALADGAGKPYLDVVQAASKLQSSIASQYPRGENEYGRPIEIPEEYARSLLKALTELDKPADSPDAGSTVRPANPKEESDHKEG